MVDPICQYESPYVLTEIIFSKEFGNLKDSYLKAYEEHIRALLNSMLNYKSKPYVISCLI